VICGKARESDTGPAKSQLHPEVPAPLLSATLEREMLRRPSHFHTHKSNFKTHYERSRCSQIKPVQLPCFMALSAGCCILDASTRMAADI
jgi:hypothetical protein